MTTLPIPRPIRGSAIAPVVASLLLTALVLAALAARPTSTLALSCIQPPPVAEAVANAEVAFVGTVTAVANAGKLAEVTVEEVWVGSDLPATIQLGSGRPANDPEAVWDRTYTAGTRYLFFPLIEEGQLVDGPCGFTQEWQAEFEKVRPADFRTPTSGEPVPIDPVATSGEPVPIDPVATSGDLVVPIVGVAILAIVIIGGAMLVGRRQT